jgi:hypothetical protein
MFFFVLSIGGGRPAWSLFFVLLGVGLIHLSLNLIFDLPFAEWAYGVGASCVAAAGSIVAVC